MELRTGQTEQLKECILCGGGSLKIACPKNAFSRCESCGHLFDNPRPTWQSIATFYSQNDKYDDWLSAEDLREDLWRRRLKLVLGHKREGRLLDVGAGIGQFLNQAKAHFEVHGTEISSTAVRIAKEKYGLTLDHGSLDDLPGEERFDVVTMFHVLEHVPYPGKTLAKCYSLLKKGGILVLAVPNDVDSVATRRNRFLSGLGNPKYTAMGATGLPRLSLDIAEIHVSHFTAPVLAKAVEKTGFEVVENSLDPFFVAGGFRLKRRMARYRTYGALKALTGKNLYDTIWLVAKKPAS